METEKTEFDVVVVGAGTGGTTAARFAAQAGLKVCLIDSKDRYDIGKKICGDAIGKEIFDLLQISPPSGKEKSCDIKGAKLYSPNRKKSVIMIDPKQTGYIVDRLEFGQRLLKEALYEGVDTFMDHTMALNLIYDKDFVSGVKIKTKDGEKKDLKAKITIDASGYYSPLRKKIESPLIEKEISDYLEKKFYKYKIKSADLQKEIKKSIFEKLKEQNLIDDLEFTRWWIEQRTEFKRKGKRVIKQELYKKGIDKKIIDSEVGKIKEEKLIKGAKKIIRKKISHYKKLSYLKKKKKLTNHLLRRGFNWDICKKVIDEAMERGKNVIY